MKCCWCNEEANGRPVIYSGTKYPACKDHGDKYNKPISYCNEDFDRINATIRRPESDA